MIIPGYVALNARKYPNHEAVVEPRGRHSWAELNNRVNQLANYLHDEHGISTGHRVALVLPNNFAFIVSYFAIQRLGGVVVPLNVDITSSELEYFLEDSGCDLIITCELTDSAVKPLYEAEYSAIWLDNIDDMLSGLDADNIDIVIDNDDACALLYTQDDTENPKGVLFNHSALAAVGTMFALEMQYKPESRLLSIMPFSHSTALHLALIGGTLVGATHIVGFGLAPEVLFQAIGNEGATHFLGTSLAYLMAAQAPSLSNMTSVSHWIYQGKPLASNEVSSICRRLQSDNLYGVYGLTETGGTGCLLLPNEHFNKAGSIGRRAGFNTEVRLVDENNDPVANGQSGELQITGEGLMLGYWQSPQATDECLTDDGWLKTGDIATQDEDGYYFIKPRVAEHSTTFIDEA